jgi:hypothetical protein
VEDRDDDEDVFDSQYYETHDELNDNTAQNTTYNQSNVRFNHPPVLTKNPLTPPPATTISHLTVSMSLFEVGMSPKMVLGPAVDALLLQNNAYSIVSTLVAEQMTGNNNNNDPRGGINSEHLIYDLSEAPNIGNFVFEERVDEDSDSHDEAESVTDGWRILK